MKNDFIIRGKEATLFVEAPPNVGYGSVEVKLDAADMDLVKSWPGTWFSFIHKSNGQLYMSKEEFIALIGQDVVVDYNFCGELQQWSMKNFSIKDGVIRHNRLPLIMDVFIKGAHNPHKGEATHG